MGPIGKLMPVSTVDLCLGPYASRLFGRWKIDAMTVFLTVLHTINREQRLPRCRYRVFKWWAWDQAWRTYQHHTERTSLLQIGVN
jgi:hypothetical protein